jgi:hypothetical protein
MQSDNTTPREVLDTLTAQVRQTRAAYYAGMPGVTYEDMAASAARLLRMRGIIERMQGRPVTSKPTTGQIAHLLRGNL